MITIEKLAFLSLNSWQLKWAGNVAVYSISELIALLCQTVQTDGLKCTTEYLTKSFVDQTSIWKKKGNWKGSSYDSLVSWSWLYSTTKKKSHPWDALKSHPILFFFNSVLGKKKKHLSHKLASRSTTAGSLLISLPPKHLRPQQAVRYNSIPRPALTFCCSGDVPLALKRLLWGLELWLTHTGKVDQWAPMN